MNCKYDDCDGRLHHTATYDDDTGRWTPVDYLCPRTVPVASPEPGGRRPRR